MKKTLLSLLTVVGLLSISFAQELPQNPRPGKCYVKCITKDEFKEVTETVEVKPAYSKLTVIPAVYRTEKERVLVKEATKKIIYVPATFKTVEIPYIKKEKGNRLVITPATFGKDSRTIEIFPKTSGWEYKQLEDCPSVNKEACVTACFVEYPAKYRTVPLITLTRDAYAEEKEIPQISATYKKQVVDVPAHTKEVPIPAQYSTITKTVLVSPATTKSVTIPAEYKTITKKVLVKKGGVTVWEEVDCNLLEPTLLPVYYEVSSARLTPASKKVIDDMLLPLLKGKNTTVEIMSHTDSRGNDAYNLALSQRRAEAVVNYLVGKGIPRARMLAKGYGETRLVNKCANGVSCTDAQHRQNRRTEFRILGK